MLEVLLYRYRLLSKSKYFKWAKLWAVIASVMLLGLAWACRAGEWGLVMVLGLPTLLALSSFWECLSEAYYQAVVAYYYLAPSLPTLPHPAELAADDTDDSEEAPAEELEPQAQPQNRHRALLAPPPPDATEMQAATASPNYDLTEESKLALCQFYAFLYVVVKLRKTGENTLQQMLGMPVGRYRLWSEALEVAELQIVSSRQGKAEVAELSFEEALARIAVYKGQPHMWDFPHWVYAKAANWKKYDPDLVEVNGRKVAINASRARSQGQRQAPTLLPIYPHKLQNLKL